MVSSVLALIRFIKNAAMSRETVPATRPKFTERSGVIYGLHLLADVFRRMSSVLSRDLYHFAFRTISIFL
jgi:hypothetical protein